MRLVPHDFFHAVIQMNEARNIVFHEVDQRAVSIYDSPRLRSSFGGIALFSQGFLTDEIRVSRHESSNEAACKLTFFAETRTARLFVEKLLERSVIVAIRFHV